jgi:hypothetical protein
VFRVPRIGLLLAHHRRSNLGRIAHPQLVPKFRQHGLEPVRVSGGFDPHSHLTAQRRVKSSRLSAFVLQSLFHQLSPVRVQHGNLLVACSKSQPIIIIAWLLSSEPWLLERSQVYSPARSRRSYLISHPKSRCPRTMSVREWVLKNSAFGRSMCGLGAAEFLSFSRW